MSDVLNSVGWFWCLVGLISILVLLAIFAFLHTENVPKWRIDGSRVIITGGSSGIGLSTALLLARKGAKAITIIARDEKKLNEALPQIQRVNPSTQVYTVSADVSKQSTVQAACERAIELMGGLDGVICSAGASLPCLFIATPEKEFDRLMQINYLGIVYTLKTCVPHLIRNSLQGERTGRIMIISSMAGLSGVAGYTAYSASKFALRGLAEALHMELNGPYKISVSLCNPPDVDTPMFAAENDIKPLECRRISEGSGLYTSTQIAEDIVNALESWKFLVNTGFDGRLLAFLASGTSPAHSGITGTIELLSLGLIRVISLVYRAVYNRIVLRVHQDRLQGKLKDVASEAYEQIIDQVRTSYGSVDEQDSKSSQDAPILKS